MKPLKHPQAEMLRKSLSNKIKAAKKIRKNFVIHAKQFSGSPLTISEWFGRLGNNIQQVCLGILYAQKNNLRFISPKHELINSISYQYNGIYCLLPKLTNRFFSFTDSEAVPDTDLTYQHIKDHIYEIAQRYIYPNLLVPKLEPLGQDCLVIHLRGGDVFNKNVVIHEAYVQNPLSYYLELIKRFKKTIVVAEPGSFNPILDKLVQIPSVLIQSGSLEDDFSTLLRAKNLASSGVGTFAIAAALCSKNLEQFFYSDCYLTEHLNPEWLPKKINKICIPLPNYIEIGHWSNSDENQELLLTYQLQGFADINQSSPTPMAK